MMAILSWIIFTIAIGLIQPPPHSCWKEMNATHQLIERVSSTSTSSPTTTFIKIKMTTRRKKFTTTTTLALDDEEEDDQIDSDEEEDNPINENYRISSTVRSATTKLLGNPLSIHRTNYSLVKPVSSTILYEKKDVRNIFMVFLLLIIIGEFFSAPAMTLAVSSRRNVRLCIGFGSFSGRLHALVPRAGHRTLRPATDVRQFRLGFGDFHRGDDSR